MIIKEPILFYDSPGIHDMLTFNSSITDSSGTQLNLWASKSQMRHNIMGPTGFEFIDYGSAFNSFTFITSMTFRPQRGI